MKRVPVTIGFGHPGVRHEIGFMEVDETKLPKGADYVFGLGGRIIDGDYTPGEKTYLAVVREFELLQVAVLSDREYFEYLKAREAAGCL